MKLLNPLYPLSFFCFFLGACTTLEDQAHELYQEGQYERAMMLYERLVNKQPGNVTLRKQLERSRLGWIDQSLIQTRMFRISGQLMKAVSLLEKVISNEKKWSLSAPGAVAFTQKEETDFAIKAITSLTYSSLAKNFPLKAHIRLKDYIGLFSNPRSRDHWEKLSNEVELVGQNQCEKWSETLIKGEIVFKEFMSHYCGLWNIELDLNRQDLHYAQKQFFSDLELVSEQESFDREKIHRLEKFLRDKMNKSPWYHPNSPHVMLLKVTGSYLFEYGSKPKTVLHTYVKSVPYQVSRTEQKPSYHPGPTVLNHMARGLDLASTILSVLTQSDVSRTDNGDGTITVQETVYRDETRRTTYQATEHREWFSYKSQISSAAMISPFDSFHQQEDQRISISHDHYRANVSLFPKMADIRGVDYWFDEQARIAAEKFGQDLHESWKNTYCSRNDPKYQFSEREDVMRCLQAPGDTIPKFVYRWVQAHFNLSVADFERWAVPL